MSVHESDGASQDDTSQGDSPSSGLDYAARFVVRSGTGATGKVVFAGSIEDCVEHNRLRAGHLRVWRSDGVAMTEVKLAARAAVELVDSEEAAPLLV